MICFTKAGPIIICSSAWKPTVMVNICSIAMTGTGFFKRVQDKSLTVTALSTVLYCLLKNCMVCVYSTVIWAIEQEIKSDTIKFLFNLFQKRLRSSTDPNKIIFLLREWLIFGNIRIGDWAAAASAVLLYIDQFQCRGHFVVKSISNSLTLCHELVN